MKEPVDHILRPRLPWRAPDEPAITECGYDASKVKTLTRDEFLAREKDMGRQRTALLTCMTCSDAARRWPTWETDPRKALEREIAWESGWRARDNGNRLLYELEAIAELVRSHYHEFRATLERHAWVRQKEARAKASPVLRDGPKAL